MKTDFLLFSEKMFWRKPKCYFNFCSCLLANLHVFSSLANRSAPVGMWYREARSVFIDCLISPLFEKDAIKMGRHGLLFPSRLTVHILSKLYAKQYSLCLRLSTTLCVLVGVCVSVSQTVWMRATRVNQVQIKPRWRDIWKSVNSILLALPFYLFVCLLVCLSICKAGVSLKEILLLFPAPFFWAELMDTSRFFSLNSCFYLFLSPSVPLSSPSSISLAEWLSGPS